MTKIDSTVQSYLQSLEGELKQQQDARAAMQLQHAATMFNPQENGDNLVKWQLDIGEELQRIEHLLRNHIPKRDNDGVIYFVESKENPSIFNERGINEIINFLSWYLNKTIILSAYTDEEVRVRMKQIANRLTNFIFNNYEDFGLDNKDKIKYYPMVVMNLVNSIEAAYHRSIQAGERTSLRQARTVIENIGGGQSGGRGLDSNINQSQMKTRKWYDPRKYF